MKKYIVIMLFIAFGGYQPLIYASQSSSSQLTYNCMTDGYGSPWSSGITYQTGVTSASQCTNFADFVVANSVYTSVFGQAYVSETQFTYSAFYGDVGPYTNQVWRFYLSASTGTQNVCLDADFPILSEDGSTCEAEVTFSVDEQVITDYQALLDSYKDFAWICSNDTDMSNCVDPMSDLELLDAELSKDEQLGDYAQQSSNVTEIENLVDGIDILSTNNPDSSVLSDNLNTAESLELYAETTLSGTYDEVAETVDWWNTLNSSDSSFEEYQQAWEQREDYSQNVLDAMAAATSQEAYDTAQDALEVYNSEFDNAKSEVVELQTSQEEAASAIKENESTVVSNGNTITETLTTVTNINTTSTTTVNNGETCVGDECTTTPDSEDVTTSQITAVNPDYESFEEANKAFYDGIKETPIGGLASKLENVVGTGSGSCPSLSIDLSDTPIGKTIGTNIHCEIIEDNSDTIGTIANIIWAIMGILIIVSA